MSISNLVTAGRAAHTRLMVDTCTITRLADGAFNDTTGKRAKTSSTIYSGVCRVKVAPVTQAQAADRNNVISTPVIDLPLREAPLVGGYDEGIVYDSNGYDVTRDVLERDVITVVTSINPDLVGVVFSIIGPEESTTMTARRFRMERRV